MCSRRGGSPNRYKRSERRYRIGLWSIVRNKVIVIWNVQSSQKSIHRSESTRPPNYVTRTSITRTGGKWASTIGHWSSCLGQERRQLQGFISSAAPPFIVPSARF